MLSRRVPLDEPSDPGFARRARPILDFFRERFELPAIELDLELHDHGCATPDGLRLGPSAYACEREASVVAHELFHLWARARLAADEVAHLPALVPAFALERREALPSLAHATLEEIATDLLARGLCSLLAAPFVPTYLPPPLPANHLERALHAAHVAVRMALRAFEPGPLQLAREALSRLCGHELSAVALATCAPQPAIRSPDPLARELLPLRRIAELALAELEAPALVRGLCRFLAARGWTDRRRGPLSIGDSPLELPARALAQRIRAGDEALRGSLRAFLETMAQRLAFLAR